MTENAGTLTLTQELASADREALGRAVEALERTSFAGRVTNLLGRQIAFASDAIPERLRNSAAKGAKVALSATFDRGLKSATLWRNQR